MPVPLALMPQKFRIMLGEVSQGGFLLWWSPHGMMAAGQVGWSAVPQSLYIIVTGAVILFSIGLATATFGFGRPGSPSFKILRRTRPGRRPVSAHAVSQMDVVDPADRGPGRFSQLHPVIIHTAGELGVWVCPHWLERLWYVSS